MRDIFKKAADELDIDKHLHAHLFRHTAATHLNKVSDIAITQHVLGDRIGLLRVKGKNKKQRALFVVDNLYDNLMVYITHSETLKFKKSPMFQIKSGKALSNNRIQKKLRLRSISRLMISLNKKLCNN